MADAPPQPAADDWLGWVNLTRSLGGLPSVTEVPELSRRAMLHSRYLSERADSGHYEDPSSPWYSPEGAAAGLRSNVISGPLYESHAEMVQAWLGGPFHAAAMLDPALLSVGFASYRGPAMSAGTLDVISGIGPQQKLAAPIVWPRAGSMIAPNHMGNEHPDLIAGCNAGAMWWQPVLFRFPTPPSMSSARFVGSDGSPVKTCVIDGTSYTNSDAAEQQRGRLGLAGRNTVAVIPLEPLRIGMTYTTVVHTSVGDATTTFEVGDHYEVPFSPIGGLDQVAEGAPGRFRLYGWTLDQSRPAQAIQVHVYVDRNGTPFVADLWRPDVATAFPGQGADHAFDLTIAVPAGVHQLCVYGINVGAGENTTIECRTVLSHGPP